MSSSVFKEYSPPNNGKIDSNLVILVNKFGNVTVDQTALHNLLDNDASNTSISVVRVASPTPSLQLELDEEEEKKSKLSVEMNNSGDNKAIKNEKNTNDNNESENEEDCDEEEDENEESDEIENDEDEEDELEMLEKVEHDSENDNDDETEKKRNISKKKKQKNKKKVDEAPHVSLTIENYFAPNEAKLFAAEILSYAGVTSALSIKTQYDYHRYVVENDHCYTPLTSPSQRISRVNNSLSGSREPVKSGNRFKTAKGSPIHQNVNNSKIQQQTKLNQSEKEQTKDDMDISEDNNSDTYQLQNLLDDNESDLSELSISDNDRDSDSDYHIHGPRGSRKPRRIVKGHRNSFLQNNKQTKIVRKRQSISSSSHDKDMENSLFDLENSDGGSSTLNSDTREESNISKNRKRGKTPKKYPHNNNSGQTMTTVSNNEIKTTKPTQNRYIAHSSPVTPALTSTPAGSSKQSQKIKNTIGMPTMSDIQIGNTKQVIPNKNETPGPNTKINTTHSKPMPAATISAPSSGQQASQKKDKKPPAHVEALFSDMISLFSTPDIIKKVGNDDQIQKTQNNQNSPLPTVKGFMQLNPTKNKDNLPSQISIQTHSSAAELASEQDKQLDLIDSIVQQEMIQQNFKTDRQMYDDIPNIVKMLETPVVGSAMLNNVIGITKDSVVTNSSVQIATNDNNSNITLNHNLLDSLNNPDDCLTEDLLQHVAELVENKNLQEIIDTQVLGVQNIVNANHMQSITPLLTNSTIIKEKESPFVKLAAMKAASKEAAAANANRKDPVQIVRSDGRVITLPPIEAPATRGAKRRAQNQPSPSQPLQSQISQSKIQNTQNEIVSNIIEDNKILSSSPLQAKPVKKGHRNSSNSNESLSKDISSIRSVTNSGSNNSSNSSNSSSGNNNSINSKRINSNPAGTVATPESEDNMESDESWNSEDDPDRLWCICKQPHNNRFMICCDSCEDWFHGKCVNITKAMGQQMEESGIEWTCPNCIKKTQQNQLKKLQRDESRGSTPTMTINRQKNRNHTMDEFITTSISNTTISTPPTTPSATSSAPLSVNSVNDKNNKTNLTTTLSTNCIVCKKSSTRANSIYCSDECIRRHAVNALVTTKTTSSIVNTNFVNNTALNDTNNATSQTIINSESDNTINKAPIKLNKNPDEKKKFLTIQSQQTDEKSQQTPPAQQQQAKRIGLLKNKNDRVIVFERKTGRCLAGNSAPTMDNLKQWLNDNPTFEVVQPGSTQAKAIKMKQIQLRKLAKDTETERDEADAADAKSSPGVPQKIQSKLQISTLKHIVYVNPKTTATQPQNSPKNINLKASSSPKDITNTKQIGTAVVSNTSTPITTPVKNQKNNEMRSRNEPEPIRVNVKRTLKEQLSSRMQEVTDETISKMTEEEISNFANETENEMYLLFNKDTGVKYRAKYRSLMFNIKDRKNLTLFRKICDKIIEPKQLVRLSPEELASQELAKWREQENKHQLEMIKKSELDLLACAKNYVLKTHKGEEVIENRIIERGDDEDVVSLLNNNNNNNANCNENVSSTTEIQSMHTNHKQLPPISNDALYSKKDKHDSSHHYHNHHHSHSSSSSSSTSKNGGHASASKKKDHHRSRSKSHDRHEHGSSKSGKHKSSNRKHSRERKSRSRDRDRDGKQNNKDKQSSRENRDKKDKIHNKSNNLKESPNKINQKPQETANKKIIKKVVKKEEDYNLIDKILEASSSSSLDKMLYPEEQNLAKKKLVKVPSVMSSGPDSIKKTISIESDQEPSSTVTIPTPPENTYDADMLGDYNDNQNYLMDDNYQQQKFFETIWSGSINMVDVATFKICAQAVTGYCTDIKNDLPLLLDVVGRISPDTVWDYISKIKKSPNKEILILRLSTIDDAESYNALYTYLNTRKRLGVIKTASPYVKDFYLLPLAAHKSLPSILLPLHGSAFIVGDNRPDLLLGIVVKIRNKRSAAPQFISNIPTKIRKSSPQLSGTFTPPSTEERYTPPNSPKTIVTKNKHEKKSNKSKLTIGLPKNLNVDAATNIIANSGVPDDDEPYSPGGSDDIDYDTMQSDLKHNLISNTGVNDLNVSANSNTGGLDPEDIARKMEELTREIEAQKMEIALLNKGQESLDEPYSPSRPVSVSPPNTIAQAPTNIPTLANISIPSNLQEILASIKNVSSNSSMFNAGQTAPPPPKIGSIGNIFNSSNDNDDEEYTPTPVTPSCYYGNSNIEYVPKRQNDVPAETIAAPLLPPVYNAIEAPLPLALPKYDIDDRILPPIINVTNTTSKLAQLSEAELLSMVPDDIDLDDNNKKATEPLSKKSKWDNEPPPPGLEDEYE